MSNEVFAGKSKAVVDILVKIAPSGKDPREGYCAICGEKVNPLGFRDSVSMKEWTITGVCQSCQDVIFGAEEEQKPTDE